MTNFDGLDGKNVTVVLVDGTKIEGRVEGANPSGMLLKPKGKSTLELLESANISEVQVAASKPKKVSKKWVKEVNLDTVRQHLAAAHAVPLSWLNSVTDADALEYHNSLDHEDLGHSHGEKPKKAAEEKTPAAE